MYIRCNYGMAHITITTGKYSTNFKGDAEALKIKAATEIRNNLEPDPMWSSSQMLFLSSANSKIPSRKISIKWKLPRLISQPRKT